MQQQALFSWHRKQGGGTSPRLYYSVFFWPGLPMYYGITDLSTFILGTIFIVLLPGPNSLYVMSVASRWGIAAGYRGACGIFLGDLILMILSATGVASLLQTVDARRILTI